MQIEERKEKHLICKEIASVKVAWGGPACGSATWELEIRMRKSYPKLFPLGNFLGKNYFKWGRVITPRFI